MFRTGFLRATPHLILQHITAPRHVQDETEARASPQRRPRGVSKRRGPGRVEAGGPPGRAGRRSTTSSICNPGSSPPLPRQRLSNYTEARPKGSPLPLATNSNFNRNSRRRFKRHDCQALHYLNCGVMLPRISENSLIPKQWRTDNSVFVIKILLQ